MKHCLLPLAALLMLIGIVSCNDSSTTSTPPSNPTDIVFDDVKELMDSEIETYLNQLNGVVKTMQLNGQSETITKDTWDWKSELAEFYSSNINKPALFDKYEVEDIPVDSLHLSLREYTAKDEDLDVRRMTVVIWTDVHSEKATKPSYLDQLSIVKQNKNVLNNSSKELDYHHHQGVTIKNIRKAIGGIADEIEIKFDFPK